jgi:hypothetical protein
LKVGAEAEKKAKMPAGGTAGRHLKEEGPAWEKEGKPDRDPGKFLA